MSEKLIIIILVIILVITISNTKPSDTKDTMRHKVRIFVTIRELIIIIYVRKIGTKSMHILNRNI